MALSYTIGFGTIKDDKQSRSVLDRYFLGITDLESQIQLIRNGIETLSDESELFQVLEHQGTVQYINLPQYYRERKLLKKAETNYEQEIKGIQLVFGQLHRLYLLIKLNLASIYWDQGRWKEAEQLQMQVMKTRKKILGEEHSVMQTVPQEKKV